MREICVVRMGVRRDVLYICVIVDYLSQFTQVYLRLLTDSVHYVRASVR